MSTAARSVSRRPLRDGVVGNHRLCGRKRERRVAAGASTRRFVGPPKIPLPPKASDNQVCERIPLIALTSRTSGGVANQINSLAAGVTPSPMLQLSQAFPCCFNRLQWCAANPCNMIVASSDHVRKHGKRRAIGMDWTNPDSWKLPAALIDYWKTIIGGLVVIAGGLATILKLGSQPFRWAWSKIAPKRSQPSTAVAAESSHVGTRPLRFVVQDRQTFCGPARRGQEPGTQLAGHWHVTNVSGASLVLLKARVYGHHAEFSDVATRHSRSDMFSSRYPVLPGRMTEVGANFMFFPRIHTEGEPFVADVIFTDNYENEHRIKSVKFRPIGDRSPSAPAP